MHNRVVLSGGEHNDHEGHHGAQHRAPLHPH
jgi:hypothetical protein